MRMPRFQFSLRTLLIVVTLLAIPCGYVGWQAKIVRDRKTIFMRLQRIHELASGQDSDLFFFFAHYHAQAEVPWVRCLFGDEGVNVLLLPESTQTSEVEEIKRAFPEADVVVNGKEWQQTVPLLPTTLTGNPN